MKSCIICGVTTVSVDGRFCIECTASLRKLISQQGGFQPAQSGSESVKEDEADDKP